MLDKLITDKVISEDEVYESKIEHIDLAIKLIQDIYPEIQLEDIRILLREKEI